MIAPRSDIKRAGRGLHNGRLPNRGAISTPVLAAAGRRAESMLRSTRAERKADCAEIDYCAAWEDPFAGLPDPQRASMGRSQERREARRIRSLRRQTPRVRIVRATPRIRGSFAGRHDARPRHRGASSLSRTGSAASGGSGGKGGGGDGEPPGAAPDEGPSDAEARRLAERLEELHPDVLTFGTLEETVNPALANLDADQKGRAKVRIFRALPARLRFTVLRDYVAGLNAPWSALSDVANGRATLCSLCYEPLEPSEVVDESGICPNCWEVPEDYGDDPDLARVGDMTWRTFGTPDRLVPQQDRGGGLS